MIDIQKIAREAGLSPASYFNETGHALESLERFAALYREALIAELIAGSGEPYFENLEIGFRTYTADQLAGAVLRERERCANVCENFERKGAWITKEEAAKAIRQSK